MQMIGHKDFRSEAEMKADYIERKKRMLQPVVNTAEYRKYVEALERKNEEIEALELKIEVMSLNQADYQAAMLCQGYLIADLQDKLEAFETGAEEQARKRNRRRHPKAIIEEVIEREASPFTFYEIVGVNRKRELVKIRHKCMRAVYEERDDLSSTEIGKIFNREHTALLYACGRTARGKRALEAKGIS